jgi:hypothetical protein
MHVAFAIADGGPGVGLVRKHEQTGRREPRPNEYIFAGDPDGTKPIRPDSLSDRHAEARGHSNVTLQDLLH